MDHPIRCFQALRGSDMSLVDRSIDRCQWIMMERRGEVFMVNSHGQWDQDDGEFSFGVYRCEEEAIMDG